MSIENNDKHAQGFVSGDPAAQLRVEQLDTLYRHADSALAGSLGGIFFYFYAVHDQFPANMLLGWGLVGVLILLVRYGLVILYRRRDTHAVPGRFWADVYYAGTLGIGMLWGWASIYLLPESTMHLAMLYVVIAGIGAASTTLYASMKGMSACILLPSMLPLSFSVMLHGNTIYATLGMATLIYAVVMLVTGHRMYLSTLNGLRLGLENSRLVEHYRQAELDSRRSGGTLRSILDNMQDTLYRTNLAGEFVYVTPIVGRIIGYTPEELIGTKVSDLYVDPSIRDALLEQLKREGEIHNFINPLRHKDGSVIWGAANLHFYRDEHGEIAGVEGIVRDITPLKMAEEEIKRSENEYRRILENMQDTYYRTDAQGYTVRISASVQELLGFSVDEFVGKKMGDFYLEPDGREKFLAQLQANDGVLHGYEAPLRRRDGGVLWVSSNAQYYRDEDGNVAGVEGTTRDVTALKQAEHELFEAKERAQVTLQSIGDGVLSTDADGRVEYLNSVAEQLTGWTLEEVRGRPLQQVLNVVEEESREPITDILRIGSRDGGRAVSVAGNPLLVSRREGQEYSVEITVSPLGDAKGGRNGAVLVIHDVTELRGLAREMSYQASHDALTGLFNRAAFEQRLASALGDLAETEGLEHALMYLDLDQFKVVNDTCGHVAGDAMLTQLTAQLQTRVRGSDVLARLGGDEFGVLLENCALDKAASVAEDLRRITQAFRFQWSGKVFEIGVSIGLVPLSGVSGNMSSVLSAADSACYIAKELGRNRVHVFHPNDAEVARHHGEMQWIQRIKSALEEDQLTLYCQRVTGVDPRKNKGVYNEILMRLLDENGQIVPPMAFIPAAERYRLMPDIDRWVVRNTLQMLRTLTRWDADEIFAINLSGQSLGDPGFLDFVIDHLDSSGIPPENLCFEVTETAAIANLSKATRFITILKGMGCRFALDDFGSGLSSFGYLKQLPVHYLKIDGHFIREIAEDQATYAMVEAINRVGHIFEMQTIAEFVENDAILASLNRLGVDYAQGYAIAKPEPLLGILERCKQQRA